MTEKMIRALYEARLKAWAAARVPALPVAWENVDYTPATGVTYLAAYLLRGDTDSQDLAGVMRNRVGVFQVNIVAAKGFGAGPAELIAAELDALFPNNLRLTSGGFVVQSVTPLRTRQPLPSDDRYTLPVDFQYRSDSV